MALVMAGGVSIITNSKPASLSWSIFSGNSSSVELAKAGYSNSREFHQADNDPCGSPSKITTFLGNTSSAATAK